MQASASLNFKNENGRPATFGIATSFISLEQAKLNFHQEVGKKTFDDLVKEGRDVWNNALSRVSVEAQDPEQERVFYTNLWKTMLFPRYLQEIDASGKEVHKSPYDDKVESGKLVTDSGFWDSYTTVYPLQSVAFPENFGSLVEGWVNSYKEAGWLPTWPSPGQRVSMVGTMGDVSLADAIAKNSWGIITGFNSSEAYAAIRKDAFEVPHATTMFGREGLTSYVNLGYVPKDDASESVSRTLNYYVADAAIARAAKILGKTTDHDTLFARSMNYTKLFDKHSMFFRPKVSISSGFLETEAEDISYETNGLRDTTHAFEANFDPLSWGGSFTEAGAWQYRFYVPFDVEGLGKLYQGSMCDKVKEMLTDTSGEGFHTGGYGRVIHEMSEMGATQSRFGLYAHNNQPSHHILWVAKKAGCNSLADKYLRKVMSELYTTNGWSGDEDNGEMASWYVLSALGLYSLEGAKDEMVVGSPAVVSATVQLPKKRILKVTTTGQSGTNFFVQSVTWTPAGQAKPRVLTGNVIKYTDLMAGGNLHFNLGAAPKAEVESLLETRSTKRHLRHTE
jgi:predicted alpha-1,2-mannosidase